MPWHTDPPLISPWTTALGKFAFDFFPIILFFVVFKFHDDQLEGTINATAVAIVATIAQVLYTRIRHGKVERMHLITLALIVVLGGLTIFFGDATFIKWKPTIVNWLFGVVFLGSQFIGGKNLVRRMLDKSVAVSDRVWFWLNLAWVAFFITMGWINLYVAFNYPLDTWVNFKLFGMLGLTVVFVIGQTIVLMRFMSDAPAAEDADNHGPEKSKSES